jgi:pimeloyl-ACP methyl ester carboxylesterase
VIPRAAGTPAGPAANLILQRPLTRTLQVARGEATGAPRAGIGSAAGISAGVIEQRPPQLSRMAFASPSALPHNGCAQRTPRRVRACRRRNAWTVLRAALTRTHISLPSRNTALEMIVTPTSVTESSGPAVLFLHGSLHAAWCYENFLTRLASVDPGRAAAAVSLRGYTSEPPLEPGTVVSVDDVLADLVALLDEWPGPPPVIVAHSLGGYFVQRLVAQCGPTCVAALVLMASSPPSGNAKLIWRTIGRVGPVMSWRITMGFVRKSVASDAALARDMFFSRPGTGYDEAVEGEAALSTHMAEFAKAAKSRVDTRRLTPLTDRSVSRGMERRVLVVGGRDDIVVDETALAETAAFWGCSSPPVVLDGCPHDLMLATHWEKSFDVVHDWIRRLK